MRIDQVYGRDIPGYTNLVHVERVVPRVLAGAMGSTSSDSHTAYYVLFTIRRTFPATKATRYFTIGDRPSRAIDAIWLVPIIAFMTGERRFRTV